MDYILFSFKRYKKNNDQVVISTRDIVEMDPPKGDYVTCHYKDLIDRPCKKKTYAKPGAAHKGCFWLPELDLWEAERIVTEYYENRKKNVNSFLFIV